MSHHDNGAHDPFENPDRFSPARTRDAEGGRHRRGRRGGVMVAAGVLAAALTAGGVHVLSQPDEPEQDQGSPQPVALSSDGLPTQATPELVTETVPLARAALAGGLPLPQGLTASTPDEVPERVLTSYRRAEATMANDQAGCRLPWWVVAAVGKVESDHANRGTVDDDGNVLPPLRGPRLDGSIVDTRAVPDTDGGRLDGDALNDRAMGPMQIVPSTWQLMARDGNGDGVADPDNIDDATLTAANFLCSSGQDFGTEQGLASGVLYVNDRADHARNVLTWASYYRGAAEPPAVTPVPAPTSSPTLRSGTSGRPPIGATPTAGADTTAPAPIADPITPPPAAPAAPSRGEPSAAPTAPAGPAAPGAPTRTSPAPTPTAAPPPASTPTSAPPPASAPISTPPPASAPTAAPPPAQAPTQAPPPMRTSTPTSTSSPRATSPEPTREPRRSTTPAPTQTPEPTRTRRSRDRGPRRPTREPRPTATPSSPSTTPAPTQTPEPTRTRGSRNTRPPRPTRAPRPTGSSSGPDSSSAPEPTSSRSASPSPAPSGDPTDED